MGTSFQAWDDSWRQRSTQARASWPSANTSASTVTRSPRDRLAGNSPSSISGVTASMTTRRRPSAARSGVIGGRTVGRSSLRFTGARATCQIVP